MGRRRRVSSIQRDTPRSHPTRPHCSPRRMSRTVSLRRSGRRRRVSCIQWDTPRSHPTRPRGSLRRSTSTPSLRRSGRRWRVSCIQWNTPRSHPTSLRGSLRRSTSTPSLRRSGRRPLVSCIQWNTPRSHPTRLRGSLRRSTSTPSLRQSSRRPLVSCIQWDTPGTRSTRPHCSPRRMSCKLLLCRSGRRPLVSCIQWDTTCNGITLARWPAAHVAQNVFGPVGSSPAGLVYPGTHLARIRPILRVVALGACLALRLCASKIVAAFPYPAGHARSWDPRQSRRHSRVFRNRWDTPRSTPTRHGSSPQRNACNLRREYSGRSRLESSNQRDTPRSCFRPVCRRRLASRLSVTRVVAGGSRVSSGTRHARVRPVHVLVLRAGRQERSPSSTRHDVGRRARPAIPAPGTGRDASSARRVDIAGADEVGTSASCTTASTAAAKTAPKRGDGRRS